MKRVVVANNSGPYTFIELEYDQCQSILSATLIDSDWNEREMDWAERAQVSGTFLSFKGFILYMIQCFGIFLNSCADNYSISRIVVNGSKE